MWPSEPGVSDLLIILLFPIGGAIMLGVGWLIQIVRDHQRD